MNNQKGFANIVLVVVIVAIIAVGGYFVFSKKSQLSNQQPTTNQQTQTPNTQTPTKETAGWKTYRNDVYGLEVRYPANWSVMDKELIVMSDEKSQGRITFRYFGTNLNFGDNPKPGEEMGLDQFMEVAKGNSAFQNVKKTLLNGYNAYEIASKENGFTIMVENKRHVFQIRFTDRFTKSDLSLTELQVLSTFRFLK